MPSGATADCASRPRRRATSFDRYDEIACPSSTTAPRRGASSPASARSSVELPHALGPTTTVNEPSGIRTSRSEATTRRSYARVIADPDSRVMWFPSAIAR
jgi:hypothetical protein